jgi:hypothetical protein
MALPKIEYPIMDCVVPSTKRKIEFRQMLVKDEKILLMAKQAESQADIFKAIKQVVNNCVITKDFNIDKTPIFDIEYLFIKIRAASINNVSKVSYRDLDDNEVYDFDIPLDTIQVEFPEDAPSNVIKVNDQIGFTLNYPTGRVYDDEKVFGNEAANFEDLVAGCIDKVYDGDEATDAALSTKEELVEFVQSLDIKTFEKIKEFLSTTPYIKHVITYKNKLGTEKTINLTTLTDFFTFV